MLEGQSQQASSKTELRQLKSNLRNFDDLQRQSVDSISARDVLAKDLESQKLASGRAQTELERRRLEVKELTEDRLQQDVLLHEIQARLGKLFCLSLSTPKLVKLKRIFFLEKA